MGRHDVGALEEEITAEDFFGWLEFWKVEPFGGTWHQAAALAYTVAASAGAKPGKDFIEKFLPSYDPFPAQTEAEMAAEFAKLKQNNGS